MTPTGHRVSFTPRAKIAAKLTQAIEYEREHGVITMGMLLDRTRDALNAYLADDEDRLERSLIRIAALTVLWAEEYPLKRKRVYKWEDWSENGGS